MRLYVFAIILLTLASLCAGQENQAERVEVAPVSPAPEPQQKRIFGIIPNYRTFPTGKDYKPLAARAKFKIATEDSFDRGTFILSALFAGERQLTNTTPSFGQGVAGYARYLGTAYGDFTIGNFMTEAIYPSVLHQDPRYFRSGVGTAWSRARYAMSRIFWTRMDSGKGMFNFSEVAGNATAVAISNAYYPDNRTAGAAATALAVQLGLDMAGNLIKEFAPDLTRKLARKHASSRR